MFRRILRKASPNGKDVPDDLGEADAAKAHEALEEACQALNDSEAAFDEKATRIENMTRQLRRDTDPALGREGSREEHDRRDSGTVRA